MNEPVTVINCRTGYIQIGKEPSLQIPRGQVKYKGASSLGTSSDKMGKLRPREECNPHKVTQQSWPELARANSTFPPRTAMDGPAHKTLPLSGLGSGSDRSPEEGSLGRSHEPLRGSGLPRPFKDPSPDSSSFLSNFFNMVSAVAPRSRKMLRVAVRTPSPCGFRTPARHVALSTALWTARAHSVVCACAQLHPPYSFIARPSGDCQKLSGGERKERGETQGNGRGWTLEPEPRPAVAGAPLLRPRVFLWLLCLQLPLAEFKGPSDGRVACSKLTPYMFPATLYCHFPEVSLIAAGEMSQFKSG